jgi:hypothetical protein
MKTILARIGLATMIAAGSLAGLAPVAHADDFGVEFRFGDDGPRHHRDWESREWRHRDRDRDWRRPRGCFPGQAVDIARSEGLRRARIDSITPRRVVVVGRSAYGRERMVFANVRGCPVIRY